MELFNILTMIHLILKDKINGQFHFWVKTDKNTESIESALQEIYNGLLSKFWPGSSGNQGWSFIHKENTDNSYYYSGKDTAYVSQNFIFFIAMNNQQTLYLQSSKGKYYTIEEFNNRENDWYLVSLVKNSNRYKFFINGQLESSETNNIITLDNSETYHADLAFGYSQQTSRNLHGNLDDVRFYNRALSEDEISGMYSANKEVVYIYS